MPTKRRQRGRGVLAIAPDPVQQRLLAAEADARARRVLEAAAAAGEPLRTAAGGQRSPITMPEYRRGRAPANKGRRYPAEVLSAEEVQAIMAAIPGGPCGARNRALIVILWRAGLRCAEALALFPKDVDAAAGTITVLHGKGDKRRTVGLDVGALTYVDVWMGERALLGLGDELPLFCTISNDIGGRGRPLGSSSVREMLKLYAGKAGVTKRVHPHGLRHTHAFELSIEGVPVHVIKAQLGHASLEETERYIDHLAPRQVIEQLGSRTWPGDQPLRDPETTAALSQGEPATSRVSGEIPGGAIAWDPPEPEPLDLPKPAPAGEGAQRVLDALVSNGGCATQGQLTRALGLRGPTILKHLHALHERGAIQRAGVDRRRSVIWKIAPPPVRLRRVTKQPRRCAPNGEGPTRVLDALEALDGRASQAQLARVLDLTPQTVQGHCRELEAQGELVRGGLDKSTSRRGSQVWRMRPAEVRWGAGRYGQQWRLPGGHGHGATTTT